MARFESSPQIKTHTKKSPVQILFTLGIMLLVGCVLTFMRGGATYKKQLAQENWLPATAQVSNIKKDVHVSGGDKHTTRRITYYDISYDYSADGKEYSGIVNDSRLPKELGEKFEIKYNPDFPAESTDILEPQTDFIKYGAIIAVGAAAVLFIAFLIDRKNKKEELN